VANDRLTDSFGEAAQPGRVSRRSFLRLLGTAAPLMAIGVAESASGPHADVARKHEAAAQAARVPRVTAPPELEASRLYRDAALYAALPPSDAITFSAPVIAANCPDPHVLNTDGVFYMVSTSHFLPAFPIRHSTDLVNWQSTGLHVFTRGNRPRWADDHFWAPELHRVGRHYVAYYTARSRATNRLCIGAAAARAPFGPYRDLGRPLISEETTVLDATFFRDDDGRQYLYWKADAGPGDPSGPIYARELSENGLKFIGETWEVARPDQPWEHSLIEGPAVIKRGGEYFLFYSGAAFDATSYAVGVARSNSPTSGFVKRGDPILKSGGRWRGPGHNSVVSHDGHDYIVFHAWEGVQYGNVRQGLIDQIRWEDDGWPAVSDGTPREV